MVQIWSSVSAAGSCGGASALGGGGGGGASVSPLERDAQQQAGGPMAGGPVGSARASSRIETAPLETQLQQAVESLVLTTGLLRADEHDDDDSNLRELRARWLLERARLLEQSARVDALAREYAARKAARAREREAERRSRESAAEKQVAQLQEEVRHYRSLHSSPSQTPVHTARDSPSGATAHGRRGNATPHSAPSTERASISRASALAPLPVPGAHGAGAPHGGAGAGVSVARGGTTVGAPRSGASSPMPTLPSALAHGADGTREVAAGGCTASPPARAPSASRGGSGKAGELRQLRRQLQQLHADQGAYSPGRHGSPLLHASKGLSRGHEDVGDVAGAHAASAHAGASAQAAGSPLAARASYAGNSPSASGSARRTLSRASACGLNANGAARHVGCAHAAADSTEHRHSGEPLPSSGSPERRSVSAERRRSLARSASLDPRLGLSARGAPLAGEVAAGAEVTAGSDGSGGSAVPGAHAAQVRAGRRSSSRLAAACLPTGAPRMLQLLGGSHSAAVTAVCTTEWETCILSAGGDGFIQLWEWRSSSGCWVGGQRMSCRAGNVNALCYSARAKIVIAGCEDSTIRLFRISDALADARAGAGAAAGVGAFGAAVSGCGGAPPPQPPQPLAQSHHALYSLRSLRGHTDEVMSVTALGWLASGSQDATIRLWNVETGECAQTLTGHSSWVMAVAACYADGSSSGASGAPIYLLSASGDGTARLWIDSGLAPHGGDVAPPPFKLKGVLRGHDKALLAAELLPTHGLAATGSDDRTIRLWSLATYECLAVLAEQGAPVCALAWHAKRRQLLSSSEDRALRVWELAGEGRAAVASCVASTPAAGDADEAEGAAGADALRSYALAVCAAPSGLQFICGLDDGSLAVLL